MADSGAGRGRIREMLGRRRVIAALGALVLLVAAVVVSPAAYDAVRCGVFGRGCPPAAAPRLEPPRMRLLSALDIATQGKYVALGDSYSAGEGAYRISADLAPGNRCRRTSQAYFHAIAGTFPFHKGATFWACTGATTGDVLRGGNDGEPPQIDQVNGDTSLVTLSIGGNDVGFARVLTGCVVKVPWGKGCREQATEIATRFQTLRTSLRTVLDRIVAKAPSARVIVLGYPRIFSETAGQGFDNISVDDQRWLNQRAKELGDVIRQVAQAADQRIAAAHGPGSVEFVDLLHAFAGHEIGTADPYVNGLNVNLSALTAEARSFHPNAAGYRRLAQLVSRQIANGPARPILQFR
jgi:lysophospholipase L1-like esterase